MKSGIACSLVLSVLVVFYLVFLVFRLCTSLDLSEAIDILEKLRWCGVISLANRTSLANIDSLLGKCKLPFV
jgi:hypothetical protein